MHVIVNFALFLVRVHRFLGTHVVAMTCSYRLPPEKKHDQSVALTDDHTVHSNQAKN